MKARLTHISPNDHINWEVFESAYQPGWYAWDDFGWFSLDIGVDGELGTETFQVVVATPSAVARAKGDRGIFRGVIVDEFRPVLIEKALHNFVSNIQGNSWPEILDQLRRSMSWEYECM